MIEDKKKELEKLFKEASEKAQDFSNSLINMRLNFAVENPEELDEENRNELIKISREIDARISFLLRSLLVQHGQVLWM